MPQGTHNTFVKKSVQVIKFKAVMFGLNSEKYEGK
jgi:hypothetical protein